MKRQGIVDCCYVLEVDRIGYFETFHSVCVPPLLKMHLEGSSAPVTVVTAYLAFVLNTQPMQFIEPVGDGLSIPTQGQIFRVVNRSIHLLLWRFLGLHLLNFLIADTLLLPHQIHSVVDNSSQFLPHSGDPKLQKRQFLPPSLIPLPKFLFSFSFLVMLNIFLSKFYMFFPHKMIDKCLITDKQLITIFAIIHLILINMILCTVPTYNLVFSIFILKINHNGMFK